MTMAINDPRPNVTNPNRDVTSDTTASVADGIGCSDGPPVTNGLRLARPPTCPEGR